MEGKDLFQKGFNDGYQMARFEPELMKSLLKSSKHNPDSEYFAGLENGGKQYEKEQFKQKMTTASKDKDLNKGIEPE